MKFAFGFFLCLGFVSGLAQVRPDSLVTLPLNTALLIERDLRAYDHCDSIQAMQETEINSLLNLTSNKDSIITIQQGEIRQFKKLDSLGIKKDSISDQETKVLVKQANRKGRKEGGGLVLLILLVGWILIK